MKKLAVLILISLLSILPASAQRKVLSPSPFMSDILQLDYVPYWALKECAISNLVNFTECYTFDTGNNAGWFRLINHDGYGFSGDLRIIQHDGYDQDIMFRLDVAAYQTPSLIQFGASTVGDSMIDYATLVEMDFPEHCEFWIHTTQTNLQVDLYACGPLMPVIGPETYTGEMAPTGDGQKTIKISPGVVFSDGASIEELRLTNPNDPNDMGSMSYGVVKDVIFSNKPLATSNGTNYFGPSFISSIIMMNGTAPTIDNFGYGAFWTPSELLAQTNFIFSVVDGKFNAYWTTNGTTVSGYTLIDTHAPPAGTFTVTP